MYNQCAAWDGQTWPLQVQLANVQWHSDTLWTLFGCVGRAEGGPVLQDRV